MFFVNEIFVVTPGSIPHFPIAETHGTERYTYLHESLTFVGSVQLVGKYTWMTWILWVHHGPRHCPLGLIKTLTSQRSLGVFHTVRWLVKRKKNTCNPDHLNKANPQNKLKMEQTKNNQKTGTLAILLFVTFLGWDAYSNRPFSEDK